MVIGIVNIPINKYIYIFCVYLELVQRKNAETHVFFWGNPWFIGQKNHVDPTGSMFAGKSGRFMGHGPSECDIDIYIHIYVNIYI